jgi:hypothetical protein
METSVQANEPAKRVIVPGRQVRLSGQAARVGIPGPPAHGEPHIDLIRLGDIVQAIEITCGCGQRIRIQCEYKK